MLLRTLQDNPDVCSRFYKHLAKTLSTKVRNFNTAQENAKRREHGTNQALTPPTRLFSTTAVSVGSGLFPLEVIFWLALNNWAMVGNQIKTTLYINSLISSAGAHKLGT